MRRADADGEPFVVELLDRDGPGAGDVEEFVSRSRRPGALAVAVAVGLLLAATAVSSTVWSRPEPAPPVPPMPAPEAFDTRLATRLDPCAAPAASAACVRWTVAAFRDTIRPVGAVDGALVVADDLTLRAFEAESGATRWVSRAFHQPDAVVMADGVVVVAERRMRPESLSLAAMSAETGAPLGQATVGGTFAPPTIGAGVVLVHDRRRLIAFDSRLSQRRWEHELTTPLAAPPTAADDVVVYGTNDRGVFAVDAASGVVRWRTALLARLRHPPVVLGDAVVVVTGRGILGLDRESGGLRWTRQPAYPTGWLAASDGIVVVEAGPMLLGLGDDGDERWRTRLPAVPTAETTGDGLIYLAVNRSMMAVSAADGTIRWEVPLFGQWPVEAPAASGDVVLVGVGDEVVALT